MFRKSLIAAGIVVAVTAPAFAATQYFVSQDKTTYKCYVVTKIGKNGQQIGSTSYPSKTAAQTALKAAPECKPKT